MIRDSFDETLAAAFQDVSVPVGLAQRITESIARAESEFVATDSTSTGSVVPIPAHASRRQWALALGGAVIAVGLLVLLSLSPPAEKSVAESTLLDAATRLFAPSDESAGRLVSEEPAPSTFPFSPAVVEVRGMRWRLIQDFAGHQGVVYDLPGPGGEFASLYVIEAGAGEEMPEAPSLRPMTTSGCCASAWREGKLLYVLVVQGDPGTYRAYVRAASGPVA